MCRKGTFVKVIGRLRTGKGKTIMTGMCRNIPLHIRQGFIQAESVEYV